MGRTALSKRELQRAGVLARVKAGELGLKNAAEVMKLSYRQVKRLWKRYQKGGAAALKNATIKKSTECTGLRDETTSTPEATARTAKT